MLAWANYIDQGQWERAAALFADDALLQHGDDQFHGRADILAYFRRMIGKGTDGLPPHMIHTPYLFTPIVTLSDDGNTAKARWHALSMRGSLGGDASWQGGIFECVYVRRNGVWKIASQVFTPQLLGPYETGWSSWKAEVPLVPYHFQPADIGRSAALGPGVPAMGPTKAGLAALAGRVQALRDEEAVRNLQNAYGYYVDFKMWDDVTDLFAPTGSVEVAGVGAYKGIKSVRRNLEREGGPINLLYGEMYDHIQADMVVEVAADGLHARGRGIEIGMVGNNDGPAYWVLTRFDNLYVKQGDKWRFQTMRLARAVKTDYFKGWGKDWIETEPASAAYKPDGPAPATLPDLWPLERPAPVARPLPAMTIAAAEGGVRAAAGFDVVENLAGGYGQYLDDNHWEELGSLFAAQGERDSAGGGFIRTPARIASFSRKRYGVYNEHRTFANMHIRTQPVIDISPDGMKGQDRTRLFQIVIAPMNATTGRSGAMFVSGMYEDDLVFEDGVWKMKRADIDHLIYMALQDRLDRREGRRRRPLDAQHGRGRGREVRRHEHRRHQSRLSPAAAYVVPLSQSGLGPRAALSHAQIYAAGALMAAPAETGAMASPLQLLIDQAPITPVQVRVVLLCTLVTLAEGIDLNMIPLLAPAMQKAWSLDSSTFGAIFASGPIGLIVGGFGIGWLADRLGRRGALIAAMIVMTLATFATAFARNLPELFACRVATGIGFGGVVPAAAALVSEFLPTRTRASVVAFVILGQALGGLVTSLAMQTPLGKLDWQLLIFWMSLLCGATTILLFVVLPESPRYLLLHHAGTPRLAAMLARLRLTQTPEAVFEGATAGRIRFLALFTDGRALGTALLWLTFIGVCAAVSFFTNWLTLIFTYAGKSPVEGAQIASAYWAGGIVSGLLLPLFALKWPVERVLMAAILCAALCCVALGLSAGGAIALSLVLSGVAGMFVNGSFYLLYPPAVRFYSTDIRSTGIGSAIAFGRIGNVLSPWGAGRLLAAGFSPIAVFEGHGAAASALACGAFLLLPADGASGRGIGTRTSPRHRSS